METEDEYAFLRAQGIELFQGYLFARPGFASLPEVSTAGLALLLA